MHNNLALRREARKMLTCKLSVVKLITKRTGANDDHDRQTDRLTDGQVDINSLPLHRGDHVHKQSPVETPCVTLRRWQQRPLTDFLRVNHTRDFDLLLLNEASFFTHWRAREAEVSMGSSSVAGGGRGGGRIGVGIYNLALTGSVSLAVY